MSLPNEFLASSHSFHHENVTPLVIQAAHTNSNFISSATNNVAHTFNGGNFFANSFGYDVSMLPFLHQTAQRPAHVNTSPFVQQMKHTPQVPDIASAKEEAVPQLHAALVGRTNTSFGGDVATQSAYWPRQSQISPFGVLPHEIVSNQVDGEKSVYENAVNTHYAIAQSLNNLNQAPTATLNADKKSSKVNELEAKRLPVQTPYLQQKPVNDVKMLNMPEEMGYRNGIVNVVHAKPPMNVNYKKVDSDLMLAERTAVNPLPRDYRVFKPEAPMFDGAAAPVVKYLGKASKDYSDKAATAAAKLNTAAGATNAAAVAMMKNHRAVSATGSALIAQKMTEFHREDSQSSSVSLTSDDSGISEQHRYSSPNHCAKDNDIGVYNVNSMNGAASNVCRGGLTPVAASSVVGYREHHLADMDGQHGTSNKNHKVTSQFLKLPQNSVVDSAHGSVVAGDAGHSNRRAPFTPPYGAYNEQLNAAALAPTIQQKRPEKMPSAQAVETAPNMGLAKPVANGLIGYPSVIMRADRTHGSANKAEKSARQVQSSPQQVTWPNNDQPPKMNKVDCSIAQIQPAATALTSQQRHLLMGLSERQHLYFDNAEQIQAQQHVASQAKNVPKPNHNGYDGGQRVAAQPVHQHIAQNVEQPQQLQHYQQYMPFKSSHSSAPAANPVPDESHPDPATEKMFSRKRKSVKNMAAEYAPSRDPPPAHVNMYQQSMQTAPYMMDGDGGGAVANRYDVDNQYYAQSNMHSFNNAAAVGVAMTEHQHQHSNLISSQLASTVSRLNDAQAQMRNLSAMPAGLSLTPYFPAAPSNYGAQYAAATQDYFASMSTNASAMPNPAPLYGFSGNEMTSPYAEASAHSSNCAAPQEESAQSKVIVPDVEDEFRFLFDPTLPNYEQIACPAEEEALYRDKTNRHFCRRNIDFLASYMKFLENNCESEESLLDTSAVAVLKNPSRSKAARLQQQQQQQQQQSSATNADAGETNVPSLGWYVMSKDNVAKPATKKPAKGPQCNFENDPRYYPLPKSTEDRRLCDSSSDDEEAVRQKKKKLTAAAAVSVGGAKKPPVSSAEEEAKRALLKKVAAAAAQKGAKKEDCKKAPLRKESAALAEGKTDKKMVKMKPEKVTKAKRPMMKPPQKLEKLKLKVTKQPKQNHTVDKSKPKIEKTKNEIKAAGHTVVPQKKKIANDSSKTVLPRRKVSDRKAKDVIKSRMKDAIDSDDEFSSGDSDPSWTPNETDENISKRRCSKVRAVRIKMKPLKKSTDQNTSLTNLSSEKETRDSNAETPKSSKTSGENSPKLERFYMLKSQINAKHPTLWRYKGDKLQKFDHLEQNGKHLFSSTSVMITSSDFSLGKYQEVEAFIVEVHRDKVIVEMCDETDVPTDLKIKENFMKESLCYKKQFDVYIQTLISQALDSNFLSEIARENDIYFLNDVKVIDDVTSTYLTDLTAIVKWRMSSIDVVVKTWPFISIKNIRNDSSSSSKCASCKKKDAKQTAIFYGQPYQRDTLLGCNSSSVPKHLDKTVDLCIGCAREIKFFNKIWHQKYHVFVECAKYVSKKKSNDKSKSTTDILNELLVDKDWLSKLFYDVRIVWLQVWTIVQKTKNS